MPKDKLIHTQSHVGRVLKAFNEADIRIAEIVFSPDGSIRMVPEKPGTAPRVSKAEMDPPAAS
jgi:hypothetical protein